MGCDIHWNSETKKEGKWICDQPVVKPSWADEEDDEPAQAEDFPGRSRDYWLFGLLAAGVRSNWPWSFAYQNYIPEDCSPEVAARIEHDGSDGHSHGTHTRAELIAKRESFKALRAEYLIASLDDSNSHYPQALAHLDSRLEEIIGNLSADVPAEDQRIVFWFDN